MKKSPDSWGWEAVAEFVWGVIFDGEIIAAAGDFLGHLVLVALRLLLAAILP